MTDKAPIKLLLDDEKKAIKSVIAQIISSGTRNTRNGIVTLLVEIMEGMINGILDEMIRDGQIKQTRADAFYELMEEGKKLL